MRHKTFIHVETCYREEEIHGTFKIDYVAKKIKNIILKCDIKKFLKSKRVVKKLIKKGTRFYMKKQFVSGMMASALIFSYGAGAAFANEDSTGSTLPTEETLETVELNEDGTITEETTTEEATSEETTEETSTEEGTDETTEETTTEEEVVEEETEVKEEAPALVPGDFFYFAKTFMEQIRLAVTVDDYKEAQLLAEFAAERIAEANALIAEGKTEEATELLQKAIETQTAATEELENVEGTEETTTEEGTEEATEETTEVTTEETEVVEVGTEEEVVAIDEPTTEEEVTVEVKLGQNIDALLAALSHVENPRAQQALMKNIQKSFAKLDKKIAKLEKKYGTEEETTEETTTEETTTEETVATEEGTETETTEEVTEVEEETVVAATAPAKAEEKKQQAKAKVEEKKQQGKAKAEEKKQQGQEKKQQGQAKAEEKKNNKGNGNGNN